MSDEMIRESTANTPWRIAKNAIGGGLTGGIIGYFWGENGTNTGKGVVIGAGLHVATGIILRGFAASAARALRRHAQQEVGPG